MKKILVQKLLPLGLVLFALGISYYFYLEGKITFLPQKEKKKLNESFTVQIPIDVREYKLSYRDKVNLSFDIANFEEGENWYGGGEFDHSIFYEGASSLFLTSLDGQKTTVSLKKNFKIEDVLNFKFFIYLATDSSNLEEFNLIFSGSKGVYKFPIRDIGRGWNLLVLPKEKFSKVEGGEGQEGIEGTSIEEATVELVSRPKTRSMVNLDALWAEKEKDYLEDWIADTDKYLSIKKNKNVSSLFVTGLSGSRAALEAGSVKDGTFQVKFTPLKNGEFGLFLRGDCKSGYGYYLLMGGVDTDTWRIYKYGPFEEKVQSLDLGNGKIDNFVMGKEQPYWLKAEMRENRLVFYFSVNNKEFTKLLEVNDNSFASGGVGIVSGNAMFFVDDIQFLK